MEEKHDSFDERLSALLEPDKPVPEPQDDHDEDSRAVQVTFKVAGAMPRSEILRLLEELPFEIVTVIIGTARYERF